MVGKAAGPERKELTSIVYGGAPALSYGSRPAKAEDLCFGAAGIWET